MQQISMLNLDSDDDLESLFEEEEEYTDDTVFAISEDFEQVHSILGLQLQEVDAIYPQHTPQANITLLPDKWSQPIPAITFFDTGSHVTLVNFEILPKECWTSTNEVFKAANGEIFSVKLITKHPIILKIFPGYAVKHKVLGTKLPGKDVFIGFDIISKLKLQWKENGLKFGNYMLPWSSVP